MFPKAKYVLSVSLSSFHIPLGSFVCTHEPGEQRAAGGHMLSELRQVSADATMRFLG